MPKQLFVNATAIATRNFQDLAQDSFRPRGSGRGPRESAMTKTVRRFVGQSTSLIRTVGAPRRATRRGLLCALALAALVGWPRAAPAQSIDTLVTWNRVLLTTLAVPGANPQSVFFTRPLAVVSAAVFDAANSFDRVYRPAFTWVDVPAGASRDAAVAQAAHDALVSVMPSQTAVFDAALATSLAGIPAQAAADGAAVGAAAAAHSGHRDRSIRSS